MQGTKRRELAELRENIKVAVEDVARTSVGASPQEVCIIVTSHAPGLPRCHVADSCKLNSLAAAGEHKVSTPAGPCLHPDRAG